MIKILSKSLILYFFLTSILFSQIINQIEVNGNKRFTAESVIVFSKLNVGDEYNNNIINDALKNLYDTNFFEDIKISFEDNKIIIDLIENPIVEKINITGVKKQSFLDFINDSLYLKERSSFTKISLDRDINLINNILKTNGYYFSNINTSFDINEELNSISLNIDIDLGEKAKISNITFLGNKVFKDKKLLQIIASEESKFWKIISNKVYLNKNLINLDKNLLNRYYKDRGYYNVKILDNFVELNVEDSSFNLIYNIDAGEKFKINRFSLSLPTDYRDDDFKKVKNVFQKNENKNYSLRVINNILEEIELIASNRSYDFIDVSVNEKIVGKNKLDLNFIVSDAKKFYVERVNILGNYTTIEEVVRNKLIVDEGDPLNNLLFNKSINENYRFYSEKRRSK